ncbi:MULTISPECIES: Uma2 family endonuclease [unclassified Coleofasciculus]|uniref:Uma2 family endonuclease n=1 Tax=unclassified Coleofasciculus TaxID=2692782 RepID=UPI00188268B7|nr:MULTISPECIES: Uma2 family endonuclease [unclassified Coleofasciculus]MBE9125448.1 Uma2 family endonuclease [Coleofasciculus sp. LEGE 07081]MBE9147134.1 Uma2 family endonuclease [Coleofasciculus sp. LEGE 07092]
MLEYDPLDCLPSAEELPDSDDTPVDNELQDLIPSLLKAILALLWEERWDWFFGVDMGVYYHPEEPAIVPDGFLSVGVERFIDEDLRLSYVLWEEQVVPILVLEVVSHKRRGEYSTKKRLYGEMGVLYYVVYNPLRRRKSTLEVYRLVDGVYQLQSGNPVWLAEIGLGIGAERGMYQGITREWLYWYDQQGQRFLTPEEQIEQERQRVQEERNRVQLLEERLRTLGVDPDSLF